MSCKGAATKTRKHEMSLVSCFRGSLAMTAAISVLRIDSTTRWGHPFKELWAYRELVGFLTWRDVKVRYKQTVLGVAWAVIQPLMTMVLFSVVFGRVAQLPSEGMPYPLFT